MLHESIADNAAYVWLDRPGAHNALDEALACQLLAFLDRVDEDPGVRVVVIGGHGAFCSGADISVLEQVGDGRRWSDLGCLIGAIYNPIAMRIHELRKPSIAVIDGVAAGAGMSLALGCDFRIGTQNAKFVSAFSRIGLIPDSGAIWLLSRLLGYARALEVASLSRPIDAQKADQYGLLTLLVNKSEIDRRLPEFVTDVAALPRGAFLEMRRLLREAQTRSFAQCIEFEREAMAQLGITKDHAEGIEAFRQKRRPVFGF